MPTVDEFEKSLSGSSPDAGASHAVQALWWAGKDQWDTAHAIAGEYQDDPACNLVHAHLHRREGDAQSAVHWYSEAGETPSDLPIEEEWRAIAGRLLPGDAAARPAGG